MPTRSKSVHINPGHLFLILLWLLASVFLASGYAESLSLREKVLSLALPAGLSTLLLLRDPQQGYALWALGLTFLVTQTGFQANVGPLRTSALEVVLGFLLFFLVTFRRWVLGEITFVLPGQSILFAFIGFSALQLFIGFLRGDSLSQALIMFKGFTLYPLMAYVFVAGLQSEALFRWVLRILVGWYSWVAVQGLLGFGQGYNPSSSEQYYVVFRAGTDYAPENLFGITLAAVALLLIGVTLEQKNFIKRIVGFGMAALLVAGSLVSVARSALVAFVAGLLFLLLVERVDWRNVFLVLLIGAVLVSLVFVFFPDAVQVRLFQLSDSSTQRRIFYLTSGLQALKTHWPLGAGWGNSFYYYPGLGLVEYRVRPNYHIDYLNLAVQIGLVGLVFYLLFWWRVIRKGLDWLQQHADSSMSPYVHGSLAGLICLLTGAMFEHVLWRTDVAGIVGLMLGILVAAMVLEQRKKIRQELDAKAHPLHR